MNTLKATCWLLAALVFLPAAAAPGAEDVASKVAALDTEYQAAVERNDWQTMDRILHPDFVLVLGSGKAVSRAKLIESAKTREVVYEKQVEVPGSQKVRLYGDDTATVTACLWIKYADAQKKPHDYKVWFTDTYVRTPSGWRYAFGMASLHLP